MIRVIACGPQRDHRSALPRADQALDVRRHPREGFDATIPSLIEIVAADARIQELRAILR
jgi:hypothetical protein